jgi:hypothetical protein
MPGKSPPKSDEFAEEQQLWDSIVRIRQEEGVDINRILADWVESERRKLPSSRARVSFSELCNNGCAPQMLSASIALLRNSPEAEKSWSKIVGGPYKRNKAAHDFEKAARIIDDLFKGFDIAEDNSTELAWLRALGRIAPTKVAAELRLYARTVTVAERLSKDADVRSVVALAQYALVGYVRRATGSFHDRATSGLISELQLRPAYNEIAHRMWRSRNYARYEKNFGWFIDLMFAFGVVIARST